jgi:BlaI family transcriptional regulator, penicillinase repressor
VQDLNLSELQIDILRTLWAQGELNTAEVVLALANKRALAHTTVATLLTRLEKRGLVAATREPRAVKYRALVAESDIRRSMVSGLLDSLFGGDPKALVAHLVRDEEIAAGDLHQIKQLLAQEKKP